MRIKVKIFGDLKNKLGNEQIIEIKYKSTVEALFSKLAIMTRTYKKGYLGDHKVGLDLAVLINGKNMNTLEKPRILKDGDVVELIPFTVGG
ncbi:MoaD/ThiS family protein [Candidatus Bathyarchaeota archaeon]|nr:MoaD/ThiS family protein [Candidatus Bathyarchaeota archaeon]MCK5626308.1 MoaD/ThiS family protein [Candidatus Bathyarchaeota archaeon]